MLASVMEFGFYRAVLSDWLEKPILCRLKRKTLTQSIDQSISESACVLRLRWYFAFAYKSRRSGLIRILGFDR